MNPYLKNLNKIEFVLTSACTGACRHCSQGDHPKKGTHLNPSLATDLIRQVTARFSIQTVMVFGGEPLLFPEATAAILAAARDAHVPTRQLITNGHFTRSKEKMGQVVQMLRESGVNDLLLSVDAFHQETIPPETVRAFALLAKEAGIPLRLQPAWLVSPTDPNPYNQKTRALLQLLQQDGFAAGVGNVVFPEGNAAKYLAEYFTDSLPENPYEEDPRSLRTLSVDADGTLLGQNLHTTPVLQILQQYKP